MERLRIIVGGFIGLLPAGGVTWDYIQYPLGFSLLGHDVYYIEDTRLYPIYQKPGSDWNDCTACVEHLKTVMEHFDFSGHWAYRDEASGNCFGLSEEKVKEICATADVFINISCSTFLRDEYLKIPKRVLIDSDPMFTQIQYLSQEMFTPGSPGLRQMVDGHNHHLTFGENIGNADCRIPVCGLQWKPTRQPICLRYWKPKNGFDLSRSSFTTLMNWSAAKVLRYQEEDWGQKDVEFQKFSGLPSLMPQVNFGVVVNKTGGTQQVFTKEKIAEAGWQVLDSERSSGNWKSYRDFIQQSGAEFSVAKETYVKSASGWFSCRSACYLAAGKPVVTQDTGWSKYLPSGKGLFCFSTMNQAADAVKKIIAEPGKHSKAAQVIAEEYFNSDKVLSSLLNQIN